MSYEETNTRTSATGTDRQGRRRREIARYRRNLELIASEGALVRRAHVRAVN